MFARLGLRHLASRGHKRLRHDSSKSKRPRSMVRCYTRAICGMLVAVVICSGSVSAQRPKQEAVEALSSEPFAILPWDQMRAVGGVGDKVNGLASLAECSFTFAGFPRVEDLAV